MSKARERVGQGELLIIDFRRIKAITSDLSDWVIIVVSLSEGFGPKTNQKEDWDSICNQRATESEAYAACASQPID